MGVMTDKFIEAYHYYNYEVMDPRSRDNIFFNSPWFVVILITLYLKFVNSWGPNYMKDREPFQLDGIIRIYNIIQIVLNAIVFYNCLGVVTDAKFSWTCMPVLYDDSEYSLWILRLAYFFFWIKVLDLFDTIFFVLRKKFTQATFLHVYHHAIMVLALCYAIKYYPGGNPIILGFVNSFVHVVMYSYYLLSSINKEYKKSVWWKKHLTQLQLIQFFIITIHSGQLFFDNSCGYPKFLTCLIVTQNIFMVVLFSDFYRKAYLKKKTA